MLRELLRGRKRLETVAALVTLLLQTVHFLGVTVQLGFRVILLPRNTQQNTTYTHNRDVALYKSRCSRTCTVNLVNKVQVAPSFLLCQLYRSINPRT